VHPSPSTVEELRVPVRRALVVFHTEQDEREAVVFLAPNASPEDLFDQEGPFFPTEQDGIVRLFARASIVSIVVDADEDGPDSLSDVGIPYERRSVAVHLRNGRVVTGSVMSVGRTRTLDVLNQPARSFAVHAEGKVHHVAKAHVQHVVELR